MTTLMVYFKSVVSLIERESPPREGHGQFSRLSRFKCAETLSDDGYNLLPGMDLTYIKQSSHGIRIRMPIYGQLVTSTDVTELLVEWLIEY